MIRASVVAMALLLASTLAGEDPLEETSEQTLPLAADGTFAIQSIDGAVRIYGTSGAAVKIVTIRRAFSPARLNALQMHVNAKPDAIALTTSSAPRSRWGWSDRSGTIDYIIDLPQRAKITRADMATGELIIDGMRGGAINAHLASGRLVTHNCFADQTLRLGEGVLEISCAWTEPKGLRIDASVESGNAQVRVPADTSFQLDARADSGNVSSDFSSPEKRRRGGIREIKESFGENPATKLRLRVGSGNIRVESFNY
ncbi:MAG: DUF4097 domain-containing protein [Verrucomicrobiota bacterium]|nr:DUF4097 domain-containing protein [Verrucomicrobiota bacterium]